MNLGVGVGVGIDFMSFRYYCKNRKSTLEVVEVPKLLAQKTSNDNMLEEAKFKA